MTARLDKMTRVLTRALKQARGRRARLLIALRTQQKRAITSDRRRAMEHASRKANRPARKRKP